MTTPRDDQDPTTSTGPTSEATGTTTPDSDADPGQLNPRDLRDVDSGDGALDEGEPDGDPEQLNPRGA